MQNLPPDKYWHVDLAIKPKKSKAAESGTRLLQPREVDFAKAVRLYQQNPVPKMTIQSVEVIYSESSNTVFDRNFSLLQERKKNKHCDPQYPSGKVV